MPGCTRKQLGGDRISDLDSLRRAVATWGCVSLDMEPWGSGDCYDVSKIGIGFLGPVDIRQGQHITVSPRELRDLAEKHRISSSCFRVAGREPGASDREGFNYGSVELRRTTPGSKRQFSAPSMPGMSQRTRYLPDSRWASSTALSFADILDWPHASPTGLTCKISLAASRASKPPACETH